MTNAPGQRDRSWAEWQGINPWLFPSIAELSQDRGPIGHILRGIPGELQRDADRCANPFEELASMRCLNVGGLTELFRACASVRAAALRLTHKVYDRGGLTERVRRARVGRERERLAKRLFDAMYRAGAEILREGAVEAGREFELEFADREARLLARCRKKLGHNAVLNWPSRPSAESIRTNHPLEYLLLLLHLRFGPLGDPSLMFFSNRAVSELFDLLDWTGFDVDHDKISIEQIEKMRERLGLRPANVKLPYVTSVRQNPCTNIIELNTNVANVATCEWPSKPLGLKTEIKIGKFVLYGGVAKFR